MVPRQRNRKLLKGLLRDLINDKYPGQKLEVPGNIIPYTEQRTLEMVGTSVWSRYAKSFRRRKPFMVFCLCSSRNLGAAVSDKS